MELNDVEPQNDVDAHETERWASISHQRQDYSTHVLSKTLRLVGQSAFAVTERFLIFAGFGQLLIGIVTYTGKGSAFTACVICFSLSCRRMSTKLRKWVPSAFNQYVPFSKHEFVN